MSIALSSEEQVELAAQLHGVDDDRILAFEIQDADLQQPPISRGSDQHGEILIEADPSQGVAGRVPESSSLTSCFQAGWPIRISTTYLV